MMQGLTTGSEYPLGQKIAGLFSAQRASDLPASTIVSQVQDLLGSDTALLGPLRDLLQRPAYRQLQGQGAGGQSHSQLLAGRDALLQDLALTYQPAVVARLAAVIDGSLGLPPGPSPIAGAASGTWAGPVPGFSQQQPPIPPAWSAAPVPPGAAPASTPASAAPVPVPPSSGPGAVTALLIALVSLLSGAVLLALGWLLFSSRPQPGNAGAPAAAGNTAPAPAATPAPAPPPTPKQPTTPAPDSPSSAWGSASDYKFGQLPGGAYPNSCAFSVTDGNGRTTTDKSQVEYWACRDVGGNPETGYRVVWADGKETNYTFQSGGEGQVVGTNGSTYPMRWRNDSHQGDPIVVINHQDGAISWIPGQIN